MSLAEGWLLAERLMLAVVSFLGCAVMWRKSIDPHWCVRRFGGTVFFIMGWAWTGLAYRVGGAVAVKTVYTIPPLLIICFGTMTYQLVRERRLYEIAQKAIEEQLQ